MRYRKEDESNDYIFGAGDESALFNSPETVAMAVKSRLELATGDWFLNTAEGTPYKEQILGKHSADIYNTAIRNRIAGTKGVIEIANYKSDYDPNTRKVRVSATITTTYGKTEVSASI